MRHLIVVGLSLGACGKSGIEGPMTFGGRVVSVATLERGQDLYNRYCATCHGYSGKADTPQARQLDPHPRDLSKADYKRVSTPGALPTDKELGAIIRDGIPGTGMPPWPQLEGSDLDAVIQYLKVLSPRWQTPTPSAPQKDEKGSMKALPAGETAASFRAADGPVAPSQGMGTTDEALAAPFPRRGATEDDSAGSRLPRATGPEHLPGEALTTTNTDLNPRSLR
jgi:mono/diheme cytochrome c family protein